MIPIPAQYLLRFDDLCPTVSRSRWQRLSAMIEEFGIKPILAVVPDNHDRSLNLSEPDPEFWAKLGALQAAGSIVALHGFQHLCESTGKSLLQLHRKTEFAGVPEDMQRHWIQEGLSILRGHGLNPRIWVAPRHGFDRTTLRVLRKEGIRLVSDGFARLPFLRGGLTWIPQQLWSPVEKPKGLWTICIHANTVHEAQIEELRAFLSNHAAQFTSVDEVLKQCKPAHLHGMERLYAALALWRAEFSHSRKRGKRRTRRPRSA
jgi:predicted deacetylase